jgi:hypothetical protein
MSGDGKGMQSSGWIAEDICKVQCTGCEDTLDTAYDKPCNVLHEEQERKEYRKHAHVVLVSLSLLLSLQLCFTSPEEALVLQTGIHF